MIKKILVLLFLFTFCFSSFAEEEDNLPCSREGTRFHLINGMFNTSSPVIAVEKIENLLQPERESIDSQGELKNISFTYNFGDPLFLGDIFEAILQKLDDGTGEDPAKKLAKQLFGGERSQSAIETLSIIRDSGLDNPLARKENVRIRLRQTLEGYLLAGEKVVLISHSQGNFFANDVYSDIFSNSNYRKYKDVFSNLQLASPASSIVAPNSIHTKLEQDIIVNGNYLGQAATHTSTSLLGSVINDFTGHSIVKTYLGRVLVREYSTGDVDLMSTFFVNNSIDLVKKMAPNCCIDSNGDIDLADNIFERHLNGGGFISTGADVHEEARVDLTSVVCKDVVVDNFSSLFNSVVSGNVQVLKATLKNTSILGLGNEGVKILGDDPVLSSGTSHRDFILNSGMTIENFNVIGKVEITGNYFISGPNNSQKGVIEGTNGKTAKLINTNSTQNDIEIVNSGGKPIKIMNSTIQDVTSIKGSSIENSTLTGRKTMVSNYIINQNSNVSNCHISSSPEQKESFTISNSQIRGDATGNFSEVCISEDLPDNIKCYIAESNFNNDEFNNSYAAFSDFSSQGKATVRNSEIRESTVLSGDVLNYSCLIESSFAQGSANAAYLSEVQSVNSTFSSSQIGNSNFISSLVSDNSQVGNATVLNSEITMGSKLFGENEDMAQLDNAKIRSSEVNGKSIVNNTVISGNSNIVNSKIESSEEIVSSHILLSNIIDAGAVSNSEINFSLVTEGSISTNSIINNNSVVTGQSLIEDSMVSGSNISESSVVSSNSLVSDSTISSGAIIVDSTIASTSISSNKNSKFCDGIDDNDPEDPCLK